MVDLLTHQQRLLQEHLIANNEMWTELIGKIEETLSSMKKHWTATYSAQDEFMKLAFEDTFQYLEDLQRSINEQQQQ